MIAKYKKDGKETIMRLTEYEVNYIRQRRQDFKKYTCKLCGNNNKFAKAHYENSCQEFLKLFKFEINLLTSYATSFDIIKYDIRLSCKDNVDNYKDKNNYYVKLFPKDSAGNFKMLKFCVWLSRLSLHIHVNRRIQVVEIPLENPNLDISDLILDELNDNVELEYVKVGKYEFHAPQLYIKK